MAENTDSGLMWHFDRLGNINDNLGHTVKFKELVKNTDGVVTDILGNSLTIAVTSADKIGTITPDKIMLKDDATPNINTKNIVLGSAFSTTETTNTVGTAVVFFDGQSTNPGIPTLGTELLPNTTFVNANNVNTGNDAILTTANNELRVKPNTTGNPFGVMEIDVVAGKFYKVFVELSGNYPALDIIDSVNATVLEKTTDNRISVILAPTVTGKYKVRFFMYYSGNDLNSGMIAAFKYPSIREIDKDSIPQNMVITLNKLNSNNEVVKHTEVRTNIPTNDINYNFNGGYSNVDGKNLAFFYNSFSLLQYIHTTPNLSGFVKASDNITNKQYFVNNTNEYIGDFNNIPVGGLDLFNLLGNTSKEVANGVLKIIRNDVANDTEMYVDTTCGIGKQMYVSFYVDDIVGNWSFRFGEKEYNLLKHTKAEIKPVGATGDLLIKHTKGTKQKVEFVITTTTNINKLRLINLAANGVVNDTISVSEINILEFDPTVWLNITPTDIGTSTSVFAYPSSSITLISYPKDISNVSNGDYRFTPKEVCSLFGKDTFIMNGVVYTMKDSISWDDKDVIIDSSRLDLFNDKDSVHTLHQTSYDRLFMHKDNTGMLSLVAHDVINNVSMLIAQTGIIPGQELELGVTEKVDIVNIKVLNNMALVTDVNQRPSDTLIPTSPELTYFRLGNSNIFDYVTSLYKSVPVSKATRFRPSITDNKLVVGNFHKDYSKNNIIYVKAEKSNEVVNFIRYKGNNDIKVMELSNNINFGIIKELDGVNKSYILDKNLGSNNVKETSNNAENSLTQIGVDIFNIENDKLTISEYNPDVNALVLNKDIIYFGYFICAGEDGCYKTVRNKLTTKITSPDSLYVYSLGITGSGTDTLVETVKSDTIQSYLNNELLK